MSDQILLNRIRTPDGTVLTSYNVHDFKTHEDEVTHDTYMIDGGTQYSRRSVNQVPAEDLTVYLTDDHEKNREAFHWGSRGKLGDQPLHYTPLCELSTAHIAAILETQDHIHEWVRDLLVEELAWRMFDED